MVTSHQRRSGGCRTVAVFTWLFVAVLSGPGHGLERPAPAGEGRSDAPAARLHLTVRQGQLSVDMWEAEVGEVLARIGHEADVSITCSPTSVARVSAQFMEVDLEAGLRRLIQRASLNYAIRSARDSTGAVAMQEVRVFGLASEEPPSLPNATPRTGPDPPCIAG